MHMGLMAAVKKEDAVWIKVTRRRNKKLTQLHWFSVEAIICNECCYDSLNDITNNITHIGV